MSVLAVPHTPPICFHLHTCEADHSQELAGSGLCPRGKAALESGLLLFIKQSHQDDRYLSASGVAVLATHVTDQMRRVTGVISLGTQPKR